MKSLMEDFNLTEIQAAAILGNIGHECGMFYIMHERGQKEGKGGYGWAQWTGVRRKRFMTWVTNHGGNYKDDATNYSYLKQELTNDQSSAIVALQKEKTLGKAVKTFERHFERADEHHKHYPKRELMAKIALEEFHKSMKASQPAKSR